MAELKTALKQVKKLLEENHNQDALTIIEEFLDNNVEDYMLFCFAALACANLECNARAKSFYCKAISLDSKMPIAWQGLYKLYCSGKVDLDDQSIEVCSQLAALSKSDEKRYEINNYRRRFCFELGRYDQLQEDLGTDVVLHGNIVEKLATKEFLSTEELELCNKAFITVKDSLETNSEWSLQYCKFLYKTRNKDYHRAVCSFCKFHSFVQIEWIRERLLEILAIEYFCNLKITDEVASFYYKCNGSLCIREEKASNLIDFLRKNDILGALDIVDNLTNSLWRFLPLALLAIHLLAEVENWEQVVEFIQTQEINDSCQEIANCLKRRAFLGLNKFDEAKRIVCPLSCILPSYSIDCAKVKLLIGEDLDELIDHYGFMSLDAKRVRIVKALHNGTPENVLDDAASIIVEEYATWRDLMLSAELDMSLSKDPTPLLVKAARMNPRSSRVFFLLGKTLWHKSPLKARSCLERAVKIRPANEDYVKTLDDFYHQAGESVEKHIALFNGFREYWKPLWMRKRLVELSKIKQDWDTVIYELQQIVRQSTDDITSWADLAEAYSSRGNLQSSVNAYERVLEIDPRSDYIICLIQVLMRMHNLEAAAEKCASWRLYHEQSSSSICIINLLDAQVHLRLFDNTIGDERHQHLRTAFNLIDSVISQKPRISLAYKLAGDALFRALQFQDGVMMSIKTLTSWSVSCRLSAIRSIIMFYSVALHLNPKNPWAWNDLSVALICSAHANNSSENAVRAIECLRKAISLCKCSQMRSNFWTLIAEAERLSSATGNQRNVAMSAALQQHYLVRALQLNKANDEAWLRLALLYFTHGAMSQCHMAIESALKYNPQLAEAWCAWALKADSEGLNYEAMDMFRHSISIKPIVTFLFEKLEAMSTPFPHV